VTSVTCPEADDKSDLLEEPVLGGFMSRKRLLVVLVVLMVSAAWAQSTLPTVDDCDKTALVAAKLFDDLGKTPEWVKKAELIHSRSADAIEKRLATCRLVAMTRADITRVNNYADLQTWLLVEDYDTLHALTKKLQALSEERCPHP